ncbi:monovalent cation/H(+) antiporter subunit G [Gordonia desulfuricans]|uniref:Monovalent cation/H(+) antiporter subunit G n=1 Tax=Gordonia desulfuricans TaxID=89051 RepID=A0A7K3LVQ1_9ACTN|nr:MULTISPECIES: monovalent cation/H(+) antiporter subunit G [Gordonia]EMP10269.2 cation:proton antiporter [Gordonia sp. NB41Y]NDK92332.1 monovalent cation/H(+) antiporter subunit G [Gordonia desulfuricans]WLP92359.1 monovalent cation/H(+) antiporter subunit G [Gordonia sp. NB41Y]
MSISEILSAVFLLLGALMAFTAAIGIVRFPDTLSRMHAATKPQTLGLLLTLIGAMLSIGGGHVDVGMLVLAGIFALITAPVVAHRLGRLVYQEQRARDGLMDREQMERGDRD